MAGIDWAKEAFSMFGVPRDHATHLLDAVRGASNKNSAWHSLCTELADSCETLLPLLEKLEEETKRGAFSTASHQVMRSVMEKLGSALSDGLKIVNECKEASTWKLFWSRSDLKNRFTDVAERISQCLCNIPLASMVCTASIQNDVGSIIDKLGSARFELCEKDRAMFEEMVQTVRTQTERSEDQHVASIAAMQQVETHLKKSIDEIRQEIQASRSAQGGQDSEQHLLLSKIITLLSRSPNHADTGGKRVPDYLKCPITLELMSDPVVDCFGHTYERHAITDALKRLKGVSPQTNLRYPDGDPKLLTNYAVNAAIEAYKVEQGVYESQKELGEATGPTNATPTRTEARSISDGRQTATPPSVKQEIGHVKSMNELQGMVAVLQAGEAMCKITAAKSLGEIAKTNTGNIAQIVNAGAVPPLVQLVSTGNSEAKKAAVETFRSLAKTANNKRALAQAGAVDPLVQLLRTGNAEEKSHAVTLLANLAKDSQENQKLIVSAGAVEPLTQRLRSGDVDAKVFAEALLAILVQPEAVCKRRRLNEPKKSSR